MKEFTREKYASNDLIRVIEEWKFFTRPLRKKHIYLITLDPFYDPEDVVTEFKQNNEVA